MQIFKMRVSKIWWIWMWVTWVTPSFFKLSVHLLTKLCFHPTAPWAAPLNPLQLRWLKVRSSQTQFCCSVLTHHRQKHSSHNMRSPPGCWPWHQLHFLSYNQCDSCRAAAREIRERAGEHEAQSLFPPNQEQSLWTTHSLPWDTQSLGGCLVSCLHHAWYHPLSTKIQPDNLENVGTISKTFQWKQGFPHGNECFSD